MKPRFLVVHGIAHVDHRILIDPRYHPTVAQVMKNLPAEPVLINRNPNANTRARTRPRVAEHNQRSAAIDVDSMCWRWNGSRDRD
jgi:hypothetical protein